LATSDESSTNGDSLEGFRVRLATRADMDDLVHQRHMMFVDMKRGTPEELEVGDRA
jgi:hypothetical protein